MLTLTIFDSFLFLTQHHKFIGSYLILVDKILKKKLIIKKYFFIHREIKLIAIFTKVMIIKILLIKICDLLIE